MAAPGAGEGALGPMLSDDNGFSIVPVWLLAEPSLCRRRPMNGRRRTTRSSVRPPRQQA